MIFYYMNEFVSYMSNMKFLLFLQSFELIVKSVFLVFLGLIFTRKEKIPLSWVYFFIIISITAFENIAWIIDLSRRVFSLNINIIFLQAVIRFSWLLNIFKYFFFFRFTKTFCGNKKTNNILDNLKNAS